MEPEIEEILQSYYSRYGLADVLAFAMGASGATAREVADELSTEDFKAAATERLEELRGMIRAKFPTEGLAEGESVRAEPVREPVGDGGKQIKDKGYHTRPHVLSSQLNGRNGLLNRYEPSKKLTQRVYPPASRLSIGYKNAENAKISEAYSLACQVATLTPVKAARQSGRGERAAVIPDLPLEALVTYQQFLRFIQSKDTDPFAGKVTGEEETPYLLANDGTFPKAPPGWTFGAIGVVAAIGSWARANRQVEKARPVLEALAGGRVYIVDTDDEKDLTSTEPVGQHITRLATEDDLAAALSETWKIETEAQDENLHRVLRRWLLLYNEASFRDFLALRATYPLSFAYIFHDYFMSRLDPDLIASAKAAGRHVSSQAWHAADGKTDEQKRKNKETILAGLESMLFDCSDGAELIGRLSVQVGRLTGSSFPAEADLFFDRTAMGDEHEEAIGVETARNLVTAYMRLRSPSESDAGAGEEGTGEEAAGEESPEEGPGGEPSEEESPEDQAAEALGDLDV